MSQTVRVTGTIKDQFNVPVPGAVCNVVLDRTDVDDGYIAPKASTFIADGNGQVVMDLWPNSRGVRASSYKFVVTHPTTGKKIVNTTFTVPHETALGDPVVETNIYEIALVEPYEGKSEATISLEIIQTEAAAAHTARAAAEAARDGALVSETNAAASEAAAATSAATAATHEQGALDYLNQLGDEATRAETAAAAADASALAAATSETNAATSETNAATSETNAAASATSSESSNQSSIAARNKAQQWADNAENSEVEAGKYSAKHHAIKAAASATNALSSKNAAATSQTAAAASASAAATSETNAASSENAASASAAAASGSATSAASSATTATTKATQAATSATNAANSATSAASSATSANSSKDTAIAARDKAEEWAGANEDVEVETGKYSAKHHSIKSEQHAQVAQGHATTAGGHAAAAATSESNAATSESNAATSEANALSYLNHFKGRYYDGLASDPSTDPLGDPINEGAIYFNTTANELRVYNGSSWVVSTATANNVSYDNSTSGLPGNVQGAIDGLQTALDGKLSTTGKAADSDKLDGLDSSQFLRSDANGTFTGTLTYGVNTGGTVLRAGSGNGDTVLMRVDSGNGQTDTSSYGFSVLYKGSQSGNDNELQILSDNQASGTQIEAFTIKQDGTLWQNGGNKIWHSGNLTVSSTTINMAGKGDFTSGTLYCERVGNIVTLTWTRLYHPSNYIARAFSLIPAGFRPITETSNTHLTSSSVMSYCNVLSDGRFTCLHQNENGWVNLTSTSAGSITYKAA